MKLILEKFCGLWVLTLLVVLPLYGQGRGSSGSSSGGGSSSSPSRPTPSPTTRRSTEQSRRPTYVNGRVVMNTGQPVSETVSVELNCGMKPVQVIHTDLGGYFTFSIGTGLQSNMDFSASNQSPTGFGGSQSALPRRFGNSLAGCEIRVSVPGYHPLNYTLSQHSDMGRVDVGSLRLSRIAGVTGSSISVTSLLVPKDARKEYEKALKDIEKNRTKNAKEHLEKAIAKYDEYAAAWNMLGWIHRANQEEEKAAAAFEKAIAVDSQYIPPYINLAALQFQTGQYQNAVEMAGKALEMDPSIGHASFIQAMGNFNLNNIDAAEKGARDAEQGPHANIPQVHALLAEIYLQREDYPQAAVEIRTYLEESPEGQFAEEMKDTLAQIEELKAQEAGRFNSQTPGPQ